MEARAAIAGRARAEANRDSFSPMVYILSLNANAKFPEKHGRV